MGNRYYDQGWDLNGSIGDSASQWLDELLCEYVDGTMDRVVRGAFEECLRKDQHLAERVECLRFTRSLLCKYRCRAPDGLQSRILERVEQEIVEFDEAGSSNDSGLARAGSVIVTLLVAGMLAGASWMYSLEENAASPAYAREVSLLSVHAGNVSMTGP